MNFKIKINDLNNQLNQINISIIYKLFLVSIILFPASQHLPVLLFGSHKIAKITILSKVNLSKEERTIADNYTYSIEYYNKDLLEKFYYNSNAKFKHNEIVDIKVLKSDFVILNFVYIYLSSIKLTYSVILITIISAIYFSFLKAI